MLDFWAGTAWITNLQSLHAGFRGSRIEELVVARCSWMLPFSASKMSNVGSLSLPMNQFFSYEAWSD